MNISERALWRKFKNYFSELYLRRMLRLHTGFNIDTTKK